MCARPDKLKLDTIAGHGLLFGNAIVEDKEWGITLEKRLSWRRVPGGLGLLERMRRGLGLSYQTLERLIYQAYESRKKVHISRE